MRRYTFYLSFVPLVLLHYLCRTTYFIHFSNLLNLGVTQLNEKSTIYGRF